MQHNLDLDLDTNEPKLQLKSLERNIYSND